MSNPISSQSVVDLTVDVGAWKSPLELKDNVVSRDKLLKANDKFFDLFEDCLFLMIVNGQDRLIVHCMTSASTNTDRMQAQYGWILGYFQDCLFEK